MTPISVRAVTGVLAAALLLTGCGSGNRTDAATTTQLRQDMQTLAAAAAARNYPAAISALAALNADAAAAQATYGRGTASYVSPPGSTIFADRRPRRYPNGAQSESWAASRS